MNYTTYAANAHRVGGETQTEATAKMSDRLLRRRSLSSLRSIYDSLRKEGEMATTDAEYAPIRVQRERVHSIILTKIR